MQLGLLEHFEGHAQEDCSTTHIAVRPGESIGAGAGVGPAGLALAVAISTARIARTGINLRCNREATKRSVRVLL